MDLIEEDNLRFWSCVCSAPEYSRPMSDRKSTTSRHTTRGSWQSRKNTTFGWVLGGLFLVAAVVGLLYLIYTKQPR